MTIFTVIRRMLTPPEKVWPTKHDPAYLIHTIRVRDTNARLRSCIREIGADHTKTEVMENRRGNR